MAQAATVEARVELKGQLSLLSKDLLAKFEALNENLARIQDSMTVSFKTTNDRLDVVETTIQSIVGLINALEGRMTSAESAITALQALTASITGNLVSVMQSIEVGSENLSSGPIYESMLRRLDKTKITAYIESVGNALSLPNNPITAINASNIVTVSAAGHGISVDDIVVVAGMTEGRGFTSGDFAREFIVQSVPDIDTLTLQLPRVATSNGTFGGTVGVLQKILGRGLSTLWRSSDGADVQVRSTSLGSKRYNFLVKATGDICYHLTDRAASFATINAGGADIVCK